MDTNLVKNLYLPANKKRNSRKQNEGSFVINEKEKLITVETMYWTLELAQYLEDAPWPATKDELIDFAMRSGAPLEVIENLQEMEDEGEAYETIEDIWPDYPTKDDFFFNEDEY